MRFEKTVGVDAPPEILWKVLVDVESWPQLTPSMSSVRVLGGPPLRVGSRVRIKQPRMPEAEWTVTALEPDRSFTWEVRAAGMRGSASHEIAPGVGGASELTLVVDQIGPAAGIVGRLAAGITRRYMDMEADGLKRRAESLA